MPILIIEKEGRAIVAALYEVQRYGVDLDARAAGHVS
jgi:hypothetical protein